MRICQIAPELLPVPPARGGAIERWIRDAAVRLVARGHEVHVIARDHGDGLRARTIDGVHYHFILIPAAIDSGWRAGLFRGLWYYASVRRLLAQITPEVAHHHSRPAGLWLSRRAADAVVHVISLHSMEYGWGFGHRAWDRGIFRRGLNAAVRVLCVSNFIRTHTLQRYPELSDRAQTIYNGVDGDLFHPGTGDGEPGAGSPAPQAHEPTSPPAFAKASAGKQAHIILYVGRIEERKGVKLLVDAFERIISARAPGTRLLIVGPHSYWDAQPSGYYRTLADRCAANPRIEMRGPTYDDTELAGVYRQATVSVVPSVFPEALGLTSLEAQASGVPVVVSNSGGLPETVSDGESGIVFDNRSVEQLADAVLRLLGAEARRGAMAAAARAWVLSRFSWNIIAAQLEDVYLDALKSASIGAAK